MTNEDKIGMALTVLKYLNCKEVGIALGRYLKFKKESWEQSLQTLHHIQLEARIELDNLLTAEEELEKLTEDPEPWEEEKW